jgi:DNA-binding NarL/FixJ family response regulator
MSESALPYGLSQEELEALTLIVEGLSDEEVALGTRTSLEQYRIRLQAIEAKMGTKSRTESAIRAIRDGLL